MEIKRSCTSSTQVGLVIVLVKLLNVMTVQDWLNIFLVRDHFSMGRTKVVENCLKHLKMSKSQIHPVEFDFLASTLKLGTDIVSRWDPSRVTVQGGTQKMF